jgi:pimeloyl-ACP methyl ester carboxylesterase
MLGVRKVIFWDIPKKYRGINIDWILRCWNRFEVPVFVDAEPVADLLMQPIVFSHGLTANRMCYSGGCREMASCGYAVITLTHGDTSAMYSPKAGPFDDTAIAHNYELRNYHISIREREMLTVCKELEDLKLNLSLDHLVLMGHSFGGATAFSALEKS